MSAETISLIGVLLVALGIVVTAFYNVRTTARAESKDAMTAATTALEKAHAVEVTLSRDYVSRTHLREATDHLIREMQAGFKHVNDALHYLKKET